MVAHAQLAQIVHQNQQLAMLDRAHVRGAVGIVHQKNAVVK